VCWVALGAVHYLIVPASSAISTLAHTRGPATLKPGSNGLSQI